MLDFVLIYSYYYHGPFRFEVVLTIVIVFFFIVNICLFVYFFFINNFSFGFSFFSLNLVYFSNRRNFWNSWLWQNDWNLLAFWFGLSGGLTSSEFNSRFSCDILVEWVEWVSELVYLHSLCLLSNGDHAGWLQELLGLIHSVAGIS